LLTDGEDVDGEDVFGLQGARLFERGVHLVLEEGGGGGSIGEFGEAGELPGVAICDSGGREVWWKGVLDVYSLARVYVIGIGLEAGLVGGGLLEEGLDCVVEVEVYLELVEGGIFELPELVVDEVVPCVLSQLGEFFVGCGGLVE
jgi:hypothetical protein